ncbi:MAG: hypothetical protein ACKO5Q_22540, partial [Microcystaceae cyanobacterium]
MAIIRNPVTEVALIIGFFLALITDQFGQGYIYVFGIVLIVILIGVIKESQKFVVYQKNAIPLPIVINTSSPNSSKKALCLMFDIIEKEAVHANHQDNLQKILGIEKQDLIFDYSGDIFNNDQLQSFLKIVRYNLEKLKNKTPHNTVIYLAYIGPVSVGILVGTLFGTDGVRVFQYNKSSDSYY